MNGQKIQLFLAEGSISGLRIAEIKFRSERVIAASRSDLGKQMELDEVKKTGVYLLSGSNPADPDEIMLYIGESDNVAGRLKEHSDKSRKDPEYFPWRESTVAITSNDDNLTKAHALYLESKLIGRARSAARATVVNHQGADRSHTLSRADVSDMGVFMGNLEVMLPLLGMDAFKLKPKLSDSTHEASTPDKSPLFVIATKDGVNAEAQEIDSQFIMRAGAIAKPWLGAAGSPGRFRRNSPTKGSSWKLRTGCLLWPRTSSSIARVRRPRLSWGALPTGELNGAKRMATVHTPRGKSRASRTSEAATPRFLSQNYTKKGIVLAWREYDFTHRAVANCR